MDLMKIKSKVASTHAHLILIVLIGLAIFAISKLSILDSIEHKLSSYINTSKVSSSVSEVVIIKYTSDDVNRAKLAGLVQFLAENKAKSILIDVDLSKAGDNDLDNSILSNTLKANTATRIIIPVYKRENNISRPISSFKKYARKGFIDLALDSEALDTPINLLLKTQTESIPHAALVQLRMQYSNYSKTYIDPRKTLEHVQEYLFKNANRLDGSVFKSKHIIIGPDSNRTFSHASLIETLKQGNINLLSEYLVLFLFFVCSSILLRLFSKEIRKSYLLFVSAFILSLPIIINYISLNYFRILFPSTLLFFGLTTFIAYLIYAKFYNFSFKPNKTNSDEKTIDGDPYKVIEGEISIGLDGVILKADSICAKLLKHRQQELVGLPIRELSPNAKLEKWKTYYNEIADVDERFKHIFEIKVKESNDKTIHLQLLPTEGSYVSDTFTRFILRNKLGPAGTDVSLHYQAKQDRISRAFNEEGILEHLTKTLSKIGNDIKLKILLLRIDDLDEITNSLGPNSSAKLIKSFTKNLHKNTDNETTIGRMDNSDFMIILNHHSDAETDKQIQKVLKISKNSIHTSGISIKPDFNVGIAEYPAHGKSTNELIESARSALHKAINNKQETRNYSDKTQTASKNKYGKVLSEIQTAIKEQQFVLYYQPIINLSDNSVSSVEALIRWDHPTKGLIYPDDFIEQVEHSNLIRPFTKYVINQSLVDAREIQRNGFNCTISINISVRNLLDAHFPVLTAECIKKNKMLTSNLEFEISEKKIHQIPEKSVQMLERLKKNGIKFSLDNYGIESTSILNLRKLPFDKIKIHKSLVAKIIKSAKDETVIDAIIRLAHEFDMNVVAEGVETELHFMKLQQLGCDYFQGYLFSKPVDKDNLIKLFRYWENSKEDSQEIPAAG